MDTSVPTHFDNTILSAFKRCKQAFTNRHIKHLAPLTTNTNLAWGAAYAKGLEHLRKGSSLEEAKAVAQNEWILSGAEGNSRKSQASLDTVLTRYVESFKDDPVKFLEVERYLETKLPMQLVHAPAWYCGRLDGLVVDRDGDMWVLDDKTTGNFGPDWALQWGLRGQLFGYCWLALKVLDVSVRGFIIRGASPTGFRQYSHEVQGWERDRWGFEMMQTVREILEYSRTGVANRYNLGDACTWCDYKELCRADPVERRPVLEALEFKRSPWHPNPPQL
jgi:hypothetical protein